jgi:hypothetical protein
MKQILILILILSLSATTFAKKKYYNASLYLNDGSVKNGLATFVESEVGKYVFFKSNEKSDVEKIEALNIKNIVYTFDNEKCEYVFLKVYKGWKQVKIKEPIWLEIVEKGIATLYIARVVVEGAEVLPSVRSSFTFRDYYIMRDGEPAAKLIATLSTANNNQTFRAKAPLYFADYPELATKIKNKEYTWKNLEEVVKLYNNWANEESVQ